MATNRSKNLRGEKGIALVLLKTSMPREGEEIPKDVQFPTSLHLHLHGSASFEGGPAADDQSQIMCS